MSSNNIAKSFLTQVGTILVLAFAAALLRPHFPHGIAWNGRWPTSSTSAEEAYKMMAREGDPAFASLQDAIEAHEKKTATFIDARSSEEFSQGRIPHSRTLPYYEMETKREAALAELTLDSPLIIYCEGIGCELSFFLGRELTGMGYKNIRIFYGGYPEWKDTGLPIEK